MLSALDVVIAYGGLSFMADTARHRGDYLRERKCRAAADRLKERLRVTPMRASRGECLPVEEQA